LSLIAPTVKSARAIAIIKRSGRKGADNGSPETDELIFTTS